MSEIVQCNIILSKLSSGDFLHSLQQYKVSLFIHIKAKNVLSKFHSYLEVILQAVLCSKKYTHNTHAASMCACNSTVNLSSSPNFISEH